MIVLLGRVEIRSADLEEALILSRDHVSRSRSEPGCIEHGVSQSAEAPNHLVFVERWESPEALRVHFALEESQLFARALTRLASGPPEMTIYEAREMPLPSTTPGR